MADEPRSAPHPIDPAGVPRPRAVVVIPCFNHGRFVADAVRSALHQSDADTRVVVVDDGSTDSTTAALCDGCRELIPGAAERVAVVHHENRGLPASRNAGAREAVRLGWLRESADKPGAWADLLVFLDADDYIEPEFVSTLAARLLAEIGGVAPAADPSSSRASAISHAYCQERLVDKAFGIWTVPDWDPLLLLVTNLHPVTALIRSDWFFRAGGFDESMREGYEDWEFWIRLSSLGCRGVRVREPLFNWRRHSDVTMVIEAVARHELLYAGIMARHADLFESRAMELVALSNRLLRKGDGNWLDENLEAIVVRDLRAANVELWQDICKARAERDAAQAEVDRARAELAGVRGQFEQKPVVKVSRKVHSWLDSMGPFGRAVKGAGKAVARVLS